MRGRLTGTAREQIVDGLLASQPHLAATRIARLAGCSASFVYARKRRSTAGTRPWQWVKAPATRKPASVEVDAEDASDLPL